MRSLKRSLSAAIALAIVTAGCSSSHTTRPASSSVTKTSHRTTTTTFGTATQTRIASVVPVLPGALTIGSNGDLYLADWARDQILERHADGSFAVFAGAGRVGFSGDGGPAAEARLHEPAGMAFATNGVLYFADSGNGRVRAVQRDGTITTVAGNGDPAAGPYNSPILGRSAISTAIGPPNAVSVGPEGSIYVASANAVLRIGSRGHLSVVVAGRDFLGADKRSPEDPDCDPNGLAFDRSRDLFIECGGTNELLERTAAGTLVDRGPFRPHDTGAALAAAPDGSVIGLWQSSVYRITTQFHLLVSFTRVAGLGDFWPQGLAITRNGLIYLDQDAGSGIGPSSIIVYSPTGTVRVIWPAH